MKVTSTITLILALSASGFAAAQSGAMNHSSMPGMQHGDMTIAEAGKNAPENLQKVQAHQAVAVVRAVNPAKGSVTLAHEAIQSLQWPPMTMAFVVKDKKLFDKLIVGSKVNVEFTQQGSDYVVTAVK
jgi:Cu(I)/Ag(I) efflux system periplasmic protein CusF